ncbi:MAG: hypothetical protein OM95_06930 [Bdellovibrio sp. ArHS]|uniref:hypothetical protein n=1 Tax=Bdellovibrio sp. ArHS TaxID=1569284 RepID=UPI000583558C|nr:hypothetical protein [Bdellovibrio sp. ArHS]KHD88844.1 MAG: hypothetical protein OM95_06930 [Bdellovibrio sp. ArHS]
MSGTKGFPSNKKTDLGTGITENFVTVIPTDPNRNSLDVNRFAFRVGDALNPRTAGVGTGLVNDGSRDLFYVADTSTPARVGDLVRFEDGNAAFIEIPIVKVETNRFLLSINSGYLPSPGDTFFILRHTTQRVDETGSQIVIAQQGPTQFVLDGNDVEVEEDTANAANNKPLPTKLFDSTNNPINPSTIESVNDVETAVLAVDTTIQGIDFATETTLASLEAKVLSDTQLRASPVPISASSLPLPTGAATEATLSSIDTKTPALVGGAVPVTGPLTDAELRATAVPVSGPLTDAELRATPVPVSGPLTDTQLRASAVPVSAATLPLPTGAATETTLSAMSAKLPATLGQKAMTDSLAVTLSSDQSAIPTKAPVNTNGSQANTSLTATTASTATAPANAVGFIIQAPDTNTDAIRYRIGGTASTTAGMQLQPGRDSGYIPAAANVSVCATTSGTNAFEIQWILSQ